MKCVNCNAEIPVSFTKALGDNSCPACGSQIMSEELFAEMNSIRERISSADLDSQTEIKVAATLVGRWELVDKSRPQKRTPSAVTQPPLNKRAAAKEADEAEIDREILQDYPHLLDLPEDQRRLEIMAIKAELVREFALADPVEVAKSAGKVQPTSEFDDIFADFNGPGSSAYSGKMTPDAAARRQRAEALKNDVGGAFRRAD